jgi:hypothetical protein
MSETSSPVAATFTLSPPEVITPLSPEVAKTAVPLAKEVQSAVDDQVNRFMEGLLSEDVQSEAFKAKLDSAFALGREEVSVASSLMQGRLMQRNFAGVEDSSAYKAIQDMRGPSGRAQSGQRGGLVSTGKNSWLYSFWEQAAVLFQKISKCWYAAAKKHATDLCRTR